MGQMLNWIVPVVLCGVALYGQRRGVDVYAAMVAGAGEGLRVLARIVPALVALMTAVSMLRASGVMEWMEGLFAPALELIGIPAQLMPLMLVRPVSGSAALGVGAEMIRTWGPDSQPGRMAAVMLGSTETTLYTAAVYFGSVGADRTRYAVPAALCADLVGFLVAAWSVRILF